MEKSFVPPNLVLSFPTTNIIALHFLLPSMEICCSLPTLVNFSVHKIVILLRYLLFESWPTIRMGVVIPKAPPTTWNQGDSEASIVMENINQRRKNTKENRPRNPGNTNIEEAVHRGKRRGDTLRKNILRWQICRRQKRPLVQLCHRI